jgi:hypothetical protein
MDGPSLGPCSGALQDREGYMLLLGAGLSLILNSIAAVCEGGARYLGMLLLFL